MYKNKTQIIKNMLKSYLKVDNNLYISNKLFMANSAINWIYKNTKNPDVIKHYLTDIDKYLKGEYILKWHNGSLIKKRVTNNEKK